MSDPLQTAAAILGLASGALDLGTKVAEVVRAGRGTPARWIRDDLRAARARARAVRMRTRAAAMRRKGPVYRSLLNRARRAEAVAAALTGGTP